MSLLGTAVIAAIAVPAAHVLAKQPDQVPELIEAFALFAPGIAGVAVIANLSRMMFVIGRLKVAAAALAGSWLLVIVADVVLVQLVPPRLVVAALALGTTIGQTVVAIPLVIVTRRICGKAACRVSAMRRWPVWPPARQAPRWAWPSAWRCPYITSWWPSPWQYLRPAARSSRSASSPTCSMTVT